MSLYLILFAVGCALLFGATMVRPRIVYQFPYFMTIVFIAFILPQAYGLYLNESGGGSEEATFLMCLLCMGCCWSGYQPRAHPALLEKFNVPLNTGRFFHAGVALVTVGWYFTYKFGSLSEDLISSSMTGIGTIYLFFGGLVFPGFAISFYCALKERSVVPWVVTVIAAIIPIQAAIFYGRREPTVLFILSLGMCLFFLKGKSAPRWVIITAVIAAMFAIPSAGEYRKEAADDPVEAFKQLNFVEQFKEYFAEDAVSEVRNASVLIAGTQKTGDYEWGAGYWNRIVFRFVPAQLVGEGFKRSLMIGGQERDWGEFIGETMGTSVAVGSTITGLGDSFNQFGYFGCLVFALMAYIFKNLWVAANSPNGTVAQILYIQITTTGMRALTHQTLDFLPGLIYSGFFIGLVALYAREPGRRPSRKMRPNPLMPSEGPAGRRQT